MAALRLHRRHQQLATPMLPLPTLQVTRIGTNRDNCPRIANLAPCLLLATAFAFFCDAAEKTKPLPLLPSDGVLCSTCTPRVAEFRRRRRGAGSKSNYTTIAHETGPLCADGNVTPIPGAMLIPLKMKTDRCADGGGMPVPCATIMPRGRCAEHEQ